MRIVTNPAANLPRSAIDHYELQLTPQHIIVEGTAHDTRGAIPFTTVDRWIRASREFPHVVGTTAQEFIALYTQVAKEDQEIVTILSSKKIIQTHAAAVSATKTLAAAPSFKNVQIAVIDTMVTDAGVGLVALAAGEAKKASLPLRRTQQVLEAMARRLTMTLVPGTLDNLVKGGRAGWARAQLASFLQLRPLIGFRDGELASLETVRRSTDPAAALIEHAVKAHGRRRPVWVAATHSDSSSERALNLLARVRETFDVRFAIVRPFASSIYLHTGPESLGLVVAPIDELPWDLPTPPAFTS